MAAQLARSWIASCSGEPGWGVKTVRVWSPVASTDAAGGHRREHRVTVPVRLTKRAVLARCPDGLGASGRSGFRHRRGGSVVAGCSALLCELTDHSACAPDRGRSGWGCGARPARVLIATRAGGASSTMGTIASTATLKPPAPMSASTAAARESVQAAM